MTETFNALLNQPILLLVILAIGAAIGIGVEKYVNGIEVAKRKAYWRGRNGNRKLARPVKSAPVAAPQEPDRTDLAANQLKVVMGATFRLRYLLNKPERRLLKCIDRILAEESPGWRAMGQVSLGEILYSQDKDAFWAINAKRVDLLLVDADTRPLHAIEFQGTGHHGSPETAARDAIKKEALRRAGIGYIEIVSGDTPAQLRAIIRRLVMQATAKAA